jgi:flotillin
MTLQVESPTVYTSQGVPISVTGIAQVKIQGQNEDMLLVRRNKFEKIRRKLIRIN